MVGAQVVKDLSCELRATLTFRLSFLLRAALEHGCLHGSCMHPYVQCLGSIARTLLMFHVKLTKTQILAEASILSEAFLIGLFLIGLFLTPAPVREEPRPCFLLI